MIKLIMGIRENIRKEVERQGYKNLSDFCRKKGLSVVYLNQFLNKRRRFNEDMLDKIAHALGTPLYALFSDQPLIPYESKEPTLIFNSPEGEFEGVKLFDDPVSLGPGFEISQLPPTDHAPIRELLDSIERKGEYVLPLRRRGPMRTAYVDSLIKRIREYSKIPDFVFHNIRHTASTILVSEALGRGVGLADVMKILGHSKVETTMKYVHSDMDRMRKAVEILGEKAKKNN